ncbi:TPA: hypothetical protein SFZ51_001627 [Campylobacter jejuni]|uniref:5'-3' exonuclease domain-containing protein n=1 Tax=Campylobacter jejuni TaxID=197 RepID=A0A431EEF9_CAMJU|nr:hypothetical protein [Campylobacter jejuni]RTJ79644.1 hypothetical protein C3H57_04535 [Campylobacter jejuni]HEG8092007.1 hypothetical protein [Campylobacter jejuni]HEG8104678.1 hypothetical protein [Campylobacter jejuni]HEG8133841.1 hypothetical protein [Campylobacter jejuni]
MNGNDTRVILFDGSITARRAIAVGINSETCTENFLKFFTLRLILKEIETYCKSYIPKNPGMGVLPIVAFDYGGSAYRREKLKSFKADRIKDYGGIEIVVPQGGYTGLKVDDPLVPADELFPLLQLFEEKSLEREYLTSQITKKLFTSLRQFFTTQMNEIGILGYMKYGYEADDIGYLFSHCTETRGLLVSDDKDWQLNLSDRYEISRPMKGEYVSLDSFNYSLKEVVESTGVDAPEIYRHILALTGTHNNVEGYKGIGWARGVQIAKLILEGNGTLDLLDPKIKVHATVLENPDLYHFNYNIVGSDHIKEDRQLLLDDIKSKLELVSEKPTQMDYLKLLSSIGAKTLVQYSYLLNYFKKNINI